SNHAVRATSCVACSFSSCCSRRLQLPTVSPNRRNLRRTLLEVVAFETCFLRVDVDGDVATRHAQRLWDYSSNVWQWLLFPPSFPSPARDCVAIAVRIDHGLSRRRSES